MRAVHTIISGRVQGVSFRAWTREQAENLGLNGWVRNRQDGTVEALIAGDDSKVQAMLTRLHEGPSIARVDHVLATDWTGEIPSGFEVLPTV